ncbi:hypothetical protein IWQ62_000391 [Dispira parvispora]|uniref:Uncharacterized protein n=1 Tax=Dispira parvispora TaxID=1520584 RepID=A0A9W8AYG3_9FUNG|nr:hypothetical protein IWQ62_000391 [Dispira parvispora]
MGIRRAGKVFAAAIFLFTVVSYTHALPEEKKEPTPEQNIAGELPYTMTFYYSAFTEYYKSGSNETAEFPACSNGTVLGNVKESKEFVALLQKTTTGRVGGKQWYSKVPIGVNGTQNCYEMTNGPLEVYGQPLSAYTSLFTLNFLPGTLLYIKQLDGLQVTPEMAHNGCVKVTNDYKRFHDGGGLSYLKPMLSPLVDRNMALWVYAPIQVVKVLHNFNNNITAVVKGDCVIQNYVISEDPTTTELSPPQANEEVQDMDASVAP